MLFSFFFLFFFFSFKLQISCQKRKKSKKRDSSLKHPLLRGWSLPLLPLPTTFCMIKLFFFSSSENAVASFHLVPSPAIFLLILLWTSRWGRRQEGDEGDRAPAQISQLLNLV